MDLQEEVSVWSCRCSRSQPLLLALEDVPRVRLPVGLHACEICLEELRTARGKSGALSAWLRRHRTCVDPKEHLYLPADHGFCRNSDEDKNMRTRRFVYERFWDQQVAAGDCVLVRCSDKACINPYHLWISKSPAQKISPQIKTLILGAAEKGLSSKTTQRLVRERCSLELSLRSIQQVRSEILKSKSCATWYLSYNLPSPLKLRKLRKLWDNPITQRDLS